MVSARTGRVSIPRLAEGIRTARGQAGLSQAELATQLGIGQSSVGQWERGATTPTLVMFHRIVAVVGPWPLLEVLLPPDQPLSAAILERTADQPVGRPDPQEQARLVDQGHSNLEIGRRYGAPAAAVSQWREAAGLPPAIPRRRPSPRELADLVAEGLSNETIGHRYGRSAETVAKWCQADSRRRPRGWPSPQELAGLVARGLSDLQIGRRYGVVSGTVKLWRYEAELLRYHPSKRPSPKRWRGWSPRGSPTGRSDSATASRPRPLSAGALPTGWCGSGRRWRWTWRASRSCEARACPSRMWPPRSATRPRRCPGRPERPGPPVNRAHHSAAPVPVRPKGVRPIRKVVSN